MVIVIMMSIAVVIATTTSIDSIGGGDDNSPSWVMKRFDSGARLLASMATHNGLRSSAIWCANC